MNISLLNQSWRPAAVAITATSMLLVGCGSDPSTPSEASVDDRVSTSTTSEVPPDDQVTPSATPEAPAASPLEGSWQTGSVSLEDTEATLRGLGLGKWVDDYRANAPFRGDTVLMLTVEDGAWDLYGKSGGGQPEPIDYNATYDIDGNTVVFHHSEGSNTYRWKIADDTLTLDFARSTLPGYRGIPEEVFQSALYMTAAFTKQG